MEFWETILITLLIAIVLPIAFSVFWFFKVHEEKKLSSEGAIRTRAPKVLSGFFLGFALLVLCGGMAGIIYCCITDSERTTVLIVIVFTLIIALFSGLGFFGYALVRFNYVIADADGVLVCQLFRKKRYYKYEEIKYYRDSISLGMMGCLIGYDKENKKIFSIEAICIGVSSVAQKLREHGVEEKISEVNSILK